ncbi:MAG: uracil-DNA glycosylase [Burkholderiaceae bacterium]
MNKSDQHLAAAWHALDIGPLWSVTGPILSRDSTTVAMPVAAEANHANEANGVAAMGWTELQTAVAECRLCSLCESRQRTVFGAGDNQPRWLVVGEAPGAREDESGEPFVGEAGQLLNAMLASVGASRIAGVFIVNVLKCRPPGNRDPQPDELASCARYLERQVQVLQPELIFTMGRFAAQALLKTDRSIGSLRQSVHEVDIGGRRVPLVAGYHPAYFLRKPEEKFKAWQDICLARSVCDPVAA